MLCFSPLLDKAIVACLHALCLYCLNACVLKQFVCIDCYGFHISVCKHYVPFLLPAEKHCAQRPQAGKHGAEQTVRRNLFTHQSVSQSVSWPVTPSSFYWTIHFSLPVSPPLSGHVCERPQPAVSSVHLALNPSRSHILRVRSVVGSPKPLCLHSLRLCAEQRLTVPFPKVGFLEVDGKTK